LEATPANAMKFSATEPAPGVFNFTQAEEFLAVVAGSNKTVRWCVGSKKRSGYSTTDDLC
jgi:hypothetical protein